MGLFNPLNAVLVIILIAAVIYGIYKLIRKLKRKP